MSDELDRRGAVPLGWPDGASELAPLAIEEKRGWQANRGNYSPSAAL